MPEKRAIFCICINSNDSNNKNFIFDYYARYTIPVIEEYAKKVNAEFILMDKPDCKYHTCNKYKISELLDTYDRVLYMDVDVAIKRNSPDIFSIVPKNMLGIHQDFRCYNNQIIEYFDKLPDCLSSNEKNKVLKILKNNKIFAKSAGIMLVPKCYKNCFRKPKKEVQIGPNRDQIWQNILFLVNDPNFFEIGEQWNYDRPYKTEQRFLGSLKDKNHFIHFTESSFKGGHSKDFIKEFIEKYI